MRGYHWPISYRREPIRPMRPPPYGGTGKRHATSKSIAPRGASGRDSSTCIIVPYSVRLSCLPPRSKALDRDAADEPFAGEVEHRAAREVERRLVEHVGDAVGREDVLLDLHPHECQGIGGVVYVVDSLRPVNRLSGGVERRVDQVVSALLPIVGPRRARGAADPAGRREGQRPER